MSLRENSAFPSILSCQLAIMMGAAHGFSGILLPQLRTPQSSIYVTESDFSWIASLGMICRPLGVVVEGIIVDKYGRKTAMQIVSIFFIISWLFTALSSNLPILYASRIVLGFTLGMVICIGLYIAEITTPEDRGTYLSLITPSTNLGVLIVFLLGSLFHWKQVAVILAAYGFVIFFCLHFIPESHVWYMLKNRKTDAATVLQRLRNDDIEVVNYELDQIQRRLRLHEQRNGGLGYFKKFTSPNAYKPFAIFTVFSLLQQQAGYNVIIYYAGIFFSNLGSSLNHYTLSILFASISLVGSLILVAIVHKFDRITLLVSSGVCMAVTIAAAGVVLAVSPLNNHPWISVGFVFSYIFFCMMGMIDIPWMMIGEILPNHIRGSMSAIITVVIFFVSFLSVNLYPLMKSTLGMSGILWTFAAFSLLSVAFAKIFLPETRGKALTEIEEYFQK